MQGTNLINGISLRPVNAGDTEFLFQLQTHTQPHLWLIDGERDFIRTIQEQQFDAKTRGYQDAYPNLMEFIIEKHGDRLGRVSVDLDERRAHLVEVALLPQVRGQGIGRDVVRTVQRAAEANGLPMTLHVHHGNPQVRALYTSLGFQVSEPGPLGDYMVWHPPALARRTG